MALMNYHIAVRTLDEYGGGTDNHIQMQIHGRLAGQAASTTNFYLQGSGERNDLDEFDVTEDDVGDITGISLDVSGDLADKWSCNYITITKGKTTQDREAEDGFWEFVIRKELSYDRTDFSPTYSKPPLLVPKPDGDLEIHEQYVAITNYGENFGNEAQQEVMKYKETWQKTETLSISDRVESQIAAGASATLSYTPPDTGGVGGSATLSTSWQKTVSKEKANSVENSQGSEFDWAFTLPGDTAVLRRVVFEIPWGYQKYTLAGETRYFRKLSSQIIPKGGITNFYIPSRSGQTINQQKWSAIVDLLKDAAPPVQRQVRNLKDDWVAKGWVVIDNPTPLTVAAYAGGKFEKTGEKEWTESKTNGKEKFTFKETGRDDESVYLDDPSRKIQIQLDVPRKMVMYGEFGGKKRDFYQITNLK
jgi:opacity protein-like surface antigen